MKEENVGDGAFPKEPEEGKEIGLDRPFRKLNLAIIGRGFTRNFWSNRGYLSIFYQSYSELKGLWWYLQLKSERKENFQFLSLLWVCRWMSGLSCGLMRSSIDGILEKSSESERECTVKEMDPNSLQITKNTSLSP